MGDRDHPEVDFYEPLVFEWSEEKYEVRRLLRKWHNALEAMDAAHAEYEAKRERDREADLAALVFVEE